MPFSTYVIAVNGTAPLPLKWPATVRTPSRIAPLLSLKLVLEENSVTTLGQAIHLWFTGNCVSKTLVQDRLARVALGREVKALASDVSLLFGGECHFSLLRLLPFVYPFSLRCNGYVAAEIYNGTHGVFSSRGTIRS